MPLKQSETSSQEIPASALSMLADDHPELICKTPLELFETFIDDDMFEYLKQHLNCRLFDSQNSKFTKFINRENTRNKSSQRPHTPRQGKSGTDPESISYPD